MIGIQFSNTHMSNKEIEDDENQLYKKWLDVGVALWTVIAASC